jgi:hypothetical protein
MGIGFAAGVKSMVSAGKMAEKTEEFIDYWRRYKNERIRIETVSHGNSRQGITEVRYTIEGKVGTVLSLPPGFLLKDGEDYIDEEPLKSSVKAGDNVDNSSIYSFEEKFVAFSSVEQIHFLDGAKEPDYLE